MNTTSFVVKKYKMLHLTFQRVLLCSALLLLNSGKWLDVSAAGRDIVKGDSKITHTCTQSHQRQPQWATYCLSCGQLDSCIWHLFIGSPMDPFFFLHMASKYQKGPPVLVPQSSASEHGILKIATPSFMSDMMGDSLKQAEDGLNIHVNRNKAHVMRRCRGRIDSFRCLFQMLI